MTREEFAKGMSFAGVAYGKEFDQQTLEVWYRFFHGDSYDDFRTAIVRLISKAKFFPSISELRREIATIKNPSLQLSADAEWERVQRAVRYYGAYRAQEAMDSLSPTTAGVVNQMGGFLALCHSDDGDWQRRNFMALFNERQEHDTDVLAMASSQLTVKESERREQIEQKSELLLEEGK